MVTVRDVTRFGLHRMTVEQTGRYPDLEAWLDMLEPSARPLLHDYGERNQNGLVTCWLRLYWK